MKILKIDLFLVVLVFVSCAKTTVETVKPSAYYQVYDEELKSEAIPDKNGFKFISATSTETFLTHIDTNGVKTHLISLKTYFTSAETPAELKEANDGGCFIVSTSIAVQNDDSLNSFSILKVDENGQYQWKKSSIIPNSDSAQFAYNSVFQLENGGYLVAYYGQSNISIPPNPSKSYIQLILLNGNGDTINTSVSRGLAKYNIQKIYRLSSGNLAIIAQNKQQGSPGNPPPSVLLIHNKETQTISEYSISTKSLLINFIKEVDNKLILIGNSLNNGIDTYFLQVSLVDTLLSENQLDSIAFSVFSVFKTNAGYIFSGAYSHMPITSLISIYEDDDYYFQYIVTNSEGVRIKKKKMDNTSYSAGICALPINNNCYFLGTIISFKKYKNIMFYKTTLN